jgi:hypothetical protein
VVLRRDSVAVSSTDGASFSLSDIAMGTAGHAVPWVTEEADTVLLSPTELFSRGAEIEIYYEARGVAARAPYRHQITVLRDDGQKATSPQRPMVSLSFNEAAAGPVLRSRRTVQLEGLKPGSYLVEVRVTAPNGDSQVRRRPIHVVDR